ncbi:hypothetical protein, partial [Enterobacter intestinihominis]
PPFLQPQDQKQYIWWFVVVWFFFILDWGLFFNEGLGPIGEFPPTNRKTLQRVTPWLIPNINLKNFTKK